MDKDLLIIIKINSSNEQHTAQHRINEVGKKVLSQPYGACPYLNIDEHSGPTTEIVWLVFSVHIELPEPS